MRDQSYLKGIENFVRNSYNRFQNSLIVDNKKVPELLELGYCYKYYNEDSGVTIYNIRCFPQGLEKTDYRIMMHEFGHIYLGHLDGVSEDLDRQIVDVINNSRQGLVQYINKSCGITNADDLLDRIVDDPQLNHSLHNIAMDMEVNTSILSPEDIKEIEKELTDAETNKTISSVTKKLQESGLSEKEINKIIEPYKASCKIKLILPERYHFPDGSCFKNELTYPEYLILIIQNLPEFVKMLISISSGGSGDTSEVSDSDLQKYMNGEGEGDGNSSGSDSPSDSEGDGSGGGSGSKTVTTIKDLMKSCGMLDDSSDDKGEANKSNSSGDSKSDKEGKDKGSTSGSKEGKDHATPERAEADEKRKTGELKSGSAGKSNSGVANQTFLVDYELDSVDMAIDDVLKNFKARVFDRVYTKDMVYNYNRGINRTVISPVYRSRINVTTKPTIVFLIDVSGSMDTSLIFRILGTIKRKMAKIQGGLKYSIITWSTRLGEHIRDIDPRKPVPEISAGGGTDMAGGIQYFKNEYGKEAILILISDFEDDLDAWGRVEKDMNGYTLYGFNYGHDYYYNGYRRQKLPEFKNMKIKNFNNKDD